MPPAQDALPRRAAAGLAAALLGALLGGAIGWRVPAVTLQWTGFVLLPFFLLTERTLPSFLPLFGGDRNAARLVLAGAFTAGFFVAWLAFRPT